jgi:hypothetical protein
MSPESACTLKDPSPAVPSAEKFFLVAGVDREKAFRYCFTGSHRKALRIPSLSEEEAL